jgi:SpoVK/Ycf46/Vps4 family AAA+-type ATPase
MQEQALDKFKKELSAHIRARYPLIAVQTYEESRTVDLLKDLCKERQSELFIWSRTQGITKNGKPVADVTDPMGVLKWYEESPEKSVLVLKDYHPYLKEPALVRKLRDLGHSLKRSPKNIVLVSPTVTIPAELSKDVALLELPLPGRDEIKTLVDRAVSAVPGSATGDFGSLIDAAMGLTYDEIENVLAKSIVSRGSLDKQMVLEEKRQIVRKTGLLEFIETRPENAPSIGGLNHLKEWLLLRRRGLTQEARDLNLPSPKGILLVGIPGCGKSLTAVTVGREWELPLLRLDMGRMFSGLVGSSENNIRTALSICEAVSPCVLWIDEIEKGLSGVGQGGGGGDSGTSSRVFGTILTWMQEKKSPVFVVATANDISGLPPELLRKGRFDEIFFVDLPTPKERSEIFDIHMGRFKWEVSGLDQAKLVQVTEGFSGSEIEQILVGARYLAFGKNETFHQSHVLKAIEETVPLSKTMRDRIDALRSWAQHRARPASILLDNELQDRFEERKNSLEVMTKDERKEAAHA